MEFCSCVPRLRRNLLLPLSRLSSGITHPPVYAMLSCVSLLLIILSLSPFFPHSYFLFSLHITVMFPVKFLFSLFLWLCTVLCPRKNMFVLQHAICICFLLPEDALKLNRILSLLLPCRFILPTAEQVAYKVRQRNIWSVLVHTQRLWI
jgi:hypothetical protein